MNQSISILIKSFGDSDFFGKGIFISLFFLSALSWIVIGYKSYVFKQLKAECKNYSSSFTSSDDGILNLSLPETKNELNPFQELYGRMKQRTIKVLEKNQFFSKTLESQIFLTKDDLNLISNDLEAGINAEMKKIENGLFILNSSVSLAPFLGILGTVWGILISLFEMQKGSSFSNTVIIQGLSTALATTVIGLLIAIPALVGYAYLKASAKSLALDLGLFCNELISKLELQYKKVE